MTGYEIGKLATQSDVASGFTNNTILSTLDDIQLAMANNLNFVNQGFSGLNTSIITNGYETRNAIQGVSSQLANCCCNIEQAILNSNYQNAQSFANLNYNLAKNTCDIIQSGKDNTQRIIDTMTARDMAQLRDENAALRLAASQTAQNNYLLSQINPPAKPAYVVPNPNAFYGYGYGCGCNGINSVNIQ